MKRGTWWAAESHGMKDGSEPRPEMPKAVVSSRAEGGRPGTQHSSPIGGQGCVSVRALGHGVALPPPEAAGPAPRSPTFPLTYTMSVW